MAEEEACDRAGEFANEGRVPAFSEDIEFVLLAPRVIPAKPSAGFKDLELVLGRRVLRLSSSKHDVQPAGSASVTISGVGPWVSQKCARHNYKRRSISTYVFNVKEDCAVVRDHCDSEANKQQGVWQTCGADAEQTAMRRG